MSINLLPWRETQHKRRLIYFYSAWIFSLLLMFVVVWLARHWIVSVNQQLLQETQQISKKITTINNKLQSFNLNKTKRNLTLLKKISQHHQVIFNSIVAISNALPAGSYLTRIKYNNHRLLLQGHANNTKGVSAFVRKLNNIKTIKNVILDNVTQQNDSVFSIQALLSGLFDLILDIA